MSAPDPVVCTLSEWDLPQVHTLALKIQAFKEACHVASRKIDPNLTEFGADYIGAMGEFVVARELGIEVDRAIYLGGDNGLDLEKYHGWTLQVKTTHYSGPNPHVVFPRLTDFKADCCIAVQIWTPVTLAILGVISQSRFRKHCQPWGKLPDNVAVLPDQLTSLKEFMDTVSFHEKVHEEIPT